MRCKINKKTGVHRFEKDNTGFFRRTRDKLFKIVVPQSMKKYILFTNHLCMLSKYQIGSKLY